MSPGSQDIGQFRNDARQDLPAGLSALGETLLGVVRPLVPSSEPCIVLTSLARQCVPMFSDGCSLEIHTPDNPEYRIRYPRERPHRFRDTGRCVNRFVPDDEFAAVVRVRISRPESAFGTPYDGEMVYVWTAKRPGHGDQGLAELLVDRAHHLIEQRRLAEAHTQAQATTQRMRTAINTGREIETALTKLRATNMADPAGYAMLRRAGEENSQLVEDLADQPGAQTPDLHLSHATR